MPHRNRTDQNTLMPSNTVPFQDVEEAWFWFVSAQEARANGARVSAGNSLYPRPCEPLDIMKIVDGLYRNRRLVRDHLLVLRHYGRRHLPPDPYRIKEAQAHKLWREALDRMSPILLSKGIIAHPPVIPFQDMMEVAAE